MLSPVACFAAEPHWLKSGVSSGMRVFILPPSTPRSISPRLDLWLSHAREARSERSPPCPRELSGNARRPRLQAGVNRTPDPECRLVHQETGRSVHHELPRT